MTTSRTFEAPEAPPLDEWIEFTLTGVYGDAAPHGLAGTRWEETFRCNPVMTVGAATAFMNVKGVDPQGFREYKTPAMYRLFMMTLRPEDFARLVRLWDDPLRVMTPKYVGEVVEWLVEVMLGVPTGRQPGSGSGSADTSSGSPAATGSPAGTPTSSASAS